MNLKGPWLFHSLEVLIFLALTATLLQKIGDPDIWSHLAIGREIVNLGALPVHEFMVFPNLDTPGAFHEWGYGLLFYLVHEAGGFWGISMINAVLGSLTFWLLFRANGAQSLTNPLNFIVLFAVIFWMEFRLVYRVEIILYLALAFEILLLERYLLSRKWQWLTPIPAVGLLLSQAHPSVIFLIAVLGIYGLQVAWENRKNRADGVKYVSWIVYCGLGTLLAATLNPYGLTQVLLPFSFVDERRITGIVAEFMPSLLSPMKWSFLMLFAVSTAAVAVNRKRRTMDIVLLLVFGILAYNYVRNIGIFALVMYVPIARGVTDLVCNINDRLARAGYPARIIRLQWLSWVFVIILALWFSTSRILHPRWGAGPVPGLFPETAARLIDEIQPPGRIFNQYELGGYLAWMLKMNYQVFIDGRHYGMNRAFSTHQAVMHGRPGWQKALARYDVNTIIIQGTWSHEAQLVPLVKILAHDRDWGLVGRGERALLFFRKAGVPSVREQYYLDKSEIWKQVRMEAEANIGMFPNQAPAYQSLGEALAGLGERDQAIEAFRRYLRLAPDDQEAIKQLKEMETESLQGNYNQ